MLRQKYLVRQEGFAEIAAQLQGASARWWDELGAPLVPLKQKLYDDSQAALKDELGKAGYLKAFEAGQHLSFEEMVELALRSPNIADPSSA